MGALIRRHPLAAYFSAAYLLSAAALVLVYGPDVLGGEVARAGETTRSLIAFPLLVVGVGLTGLLLTAVVDGRRGLRRLWGGVRRWRVGASWYAVALLPPALILAVLIVLGALLDPAFGPHLFVAGLVFGLPAGLFEELGWTGYALPRLRAAFGHSTFSVGLLLGVMWGLWHLPVVDHLGAASPHGSAWLPFFLAFAAVVTAIRVLIVWVYTNTGSVLLAQLVHVSSTGCLVALSPLGVTPWQEASWYAVYAAGLWLVVGALVLACGTELRRGGRAAAGLDAHRVG